MRILLIAAAIALAGCSTIHNLDRSSVTQFEMTGADSWRMTATTSLNYPADSDRAEQARLGWIAQHTQEQGCTDYEVSSRTWTKLAGMVPDKVGSLLYEGRCIR